MIPEQIKDVAERHTAYMLAHSHDGAFACCKAHASADDVPALLADNERLRAALAEIQLRTVQRDLSQIARAALRGGAA